MTQSSIIRNIHYCDTAPSWD